MIVLEPSNPTELGDDDLQDIARSSYADMVNDDERNKAYNLAIKLCVNNMVKSPDFNPIDDRFFHCCDIGTGSGLLSMMIVRAFKELNYENFHVTAFEAFKPMAKCAQQVIDLNGMHDFITVIPSTSYLYDMKTHPLGTNIKFELLVAELLDTELIGEGCLAAYQHAIQTFCSPSCFFVPHQARIYAELVASSFLFHRNTLTDLKLTMKDGQIINIKAPPEARNCEGIAQLDDMQVSMLVEDEDFVRISEPQLAFTITFGDIESLKLDDKTSIVFTIHEDIEQPPVIVMWWDIFMYDRTRICLDYTIIDMNMEILSCAPSWARDKSMLERDERINTIYNRGVWREHWIQAIYYLLDVERVSKFVGTISGSKIEIFASHDSHSLWFDLNPNTKPKDCSCGVHRLLSRSQFGFINDSSYMSKLLAAILSDNKSKPEELQLQIYRHHDLSSGSLSNPMWQINSFDLNEVLIDPKLNSEVPWHHMMNRLLNGQDILPFESFALKLTQVSFDNLNRIRTNVVNCEDFNLNPLDELINNSSNLVDEPIESHYLWEYKCQILDTEYVIFTSSEERDCETGKKIQLSGWKKHLKLPVGFLKNHSLKKGWALVVWAEFKLINTGEILSTGPILNSTIRDYCRWNKHCKQQVLFLHNQPVDDIEEIGIDICLHGLNLQIKATS